VIRISLRNKCWKWHNDLDDIFETLANKLAASVTEEKIFLHLKRLLL